MRVACGVATNPLHSELRNKDLGPHQIPLITCPIKRSLAADVWALKTIKEYRGGCLLQWAWCTTGYTTEAELAEWNHGGDIEPLVLSGTVWWIPALAPHCLLNRGIYTLNRNQVEMLK